MIIEKEIDLDGEVNAFCIINNGIVLTFKSKELLDSYVESRMIKNSRIYIKIGNKLFPFERFKRFQDTDVYTIIDNSSIIYIYPDTKDIIKRTGYICFEKDCFSRSSFEEKGKEYKKNISIVKSALCTLNRSRVIKKTEKENFISYSVFGSTYKFRIIRNYKLFEENSIRKDSGVRVYPFIKDMDNLKSIYFMETINKEEKDNINYPDIPEILCNMLKKDIPEIHIEYKEFKGIIEYNS